MLTRPFAGLLAGLLLMGTLLSGCALPALEGRPVSRAVPAHDTRDTELGRFIAPQAQAHPGHTGILPLADTHDAFAARVLLARAAQKTLDVQYYIWRRDITGMLLLQALVEAADRGVRVRLLLDDNGVAGMDDILAALDNHPQIEVRLFNPFSLRSPKALGFIFHFSRANRRMHNKSFTADNQATIIGGRNVGDEYFGATDGVLFADLDVLAAGAVVPEVSDDFDLYWGSDSSYPVKGLLPAYAGTHPDLKIPEKPAPLVREYLGMLHESAFIERLLNGSLPLVWSQVSMVSDDPAKALGDAGKEDLFLARLRRVMGDPEKSFDLVSPYFVPTGVGVDTFSALVGNGVKLRVLTNALEATDVPVVHAGYAKRRRDMLEAGISLYEMRRQPAANKPQEKAGPFGSSASSLHAKTFSKDGRRAFVGSFNFDPRSANLNTELGFVIDDPALAQAITRTFDERVPAESYEVRLDERGDMVWLERRGGEVVRHRAEPGTGPLKRAWIRFLSWLPIEWML